jgi:hypothetical protein
MWDANHFQDMLEVVKRLSSAEYVTAAIFLNYNQLNNVQQAVKAISYCDSEVMFWHKEGQFEHPQGPRLCSMVEVILLVYLRTLSSSPAPAGRSMEHYNYAKTEARPNLLKFQAVRKFAKYATGHKVNPAQKPIDLLRYIVHHFSRESEWVLDICSGTGDLHFICFLLPSY